MAKAAAFPTKIKVAYARYKVVPGRKNKNDFEEEDFGQIDYKKQTIELDPKQEPDEIVNTLMHEILHAIVHTFNVPCKKDHEERIVNGIANGLTTVFKDNPKLIDWIKRKLNETR